MFKCLKSGSEKTVHEREKMGRTAGLIGIVCNALLFAFKLSAGLVFGSVSVVADAVNNLSDALSSTITVVCFRLSEKPADEEHPYGHQRIEYIAAMMVSFVILVIGYELIKTSFGKIFNPSETSFSYLTLGALAFSILVKLFMNRMYSAVGDSINSAVLKAAAQDSINDVYSTVAVLASVLITKMTNWELDGYMGLAVSAFIIWSGICLIKETADPLLGTAPDYEFVKKLENKIMEYDGIIGIHDMMVHSYGPNETFASVHAEVPSNADVLVSHDIIDNIERDIDKQYNVKLVIHMDPVVTDDEVTNAAKDKVVSIVQALSSKLSIHDFRMVPGKTHTNIVFDVVVPYGFEYGDEELKVRIDGMVKDKLGDNYYCVISVDKQYVPVGENGR